MTLYIIHNNAITKMRVNYDGKFIFPSSISLFLMCSTDSWAQNKQNYNKTNIYPFHSIPYTYGKGKRKKKRRREKTKPNHKARPHKTIYRLQSFLSTKIQMLKNSYHTFSILNGMIFSIVKHPFILCFHHRITIYKFTSLAMCKNILRILC